MGRAAVAVTWAWARACPAALWCSVRVSCNVRVSQAPQCTCRQDHTTYDARAA
jgi:hypothetical protein